MNQDLELIRQDYLKELDKITNSNDGHQEEVIHKYLERRTWLLPALTGILKNNHHGPYCQIIFSKFQLTGSFRRIPDFLFVTKTSAQATVVFIEVEDPSKKIFTRTDDFTSEFNHAYQQLQDWKIWFESDSNKSLLRQWLCEGIKHLLMSTLPMKAEFILIYGRRSEFDGQANRMRRLTERNSHPYSVMSFDRLEPDLLYNGQITVRKDDNGYYAIEVDENYDYDIHDYNNHNHIKEKETAVKNNIYKSSENKKEVLDKINLFSKMKPDEVRDYFLNRGDL